MTLPNSLRLVTLACAAALVAAACTDQKAPVATVDELVNYDAIIIGSGTRYGSVVSQIRNFWEQTGALWAKGALIGKVGSVFTSSATQHGGQESTILTTWPLLAHHGLVIVGLPYSAQGQMRIDEITGGSPYGASTITGGDGKRMPSQNGTTKRIPAQPCHAEIWRAMPVRPVKMKAATSPRFWEGWRRPTSFSTTMAVPMPMIELPARMSPLQDSGMPRSR
jgi:NAD(P)H:quinone oxidoreductase type IV